MNYGAKLLFSGKRLLEKMKQKVVKTDQSLLFQTKSIVFLLCVNKWKVFLFAL